MNELNTESSRRFTERADVINRPGEDEEDEEGQEEYDEFYKKFTASVKIAEMVSSFVIEEIKETTSLPLKYIAETKLEHPKKTPVRPEPPLHLQKAF